MKRFMKGKTSKNAGDDDADRNALFGNRPQAAESRNSMSSVTSRETALPPYQDPYASTSAVQQRTDPYLQRSARPQANGNAYVDPYASRQSTSTLAQREELFRGAKPDSRLQNGSGSYAGRSIPDDESDHTGGEGLQTQEEEEEDVEGIKQEIRFVKQESLSSTQNALRMANEAEAAGRSTLGHLGTQAETLADAERAMDMSSLASRDAQVKARELKDLNRSMFAIKVNKPWGKAGRIEAEERRVKQQFEDDRYERDLREQTRKEAERRTDANLKAHAEALTKGTSRQRVGLAERSKYQFEADESDDEMESKIDENLDQLAAVTGRLKGLAMATNQEVSRQNQQLERLDRKGEKLDTQIHLNTHRLKKINERG